MPKPTAVDPAAATALRALCGEARVQRGLAALARSQRALTDLQVEIARIPTRDMRAAERARALAVWLRETGIAAVRSDAVGNVIGVLPGREDGVVIVSAHLDTVFPGLKRIAIERQDPILRGPGISDDAAGLAALVILARAFREAGLEPRHDVAFVCTVGEEGEGDLCGVKHLFEHEFAARHVIAFLTLDLGGQQTIVNEGLGSRRLRLTLRGPGGHSWGDFGRPNPAHALARGLARFLDAEHGERGAVSFNVGTLEGGRGVNAIPESATARIDLRATQHSELQRLEAKLRRALRDGLERERSRSLDGAALELDIQVIGDRPSGCTSPDSPLVRTVVAAFAHFEIEVELATSSTDANEPMRLAVPALALPHGARAYSAHSAQEWCDVRGREPVLKAIFTAVARLAGC
jgi:acetylornithine deacetylase/succinyl-diaminopimelate desuccinylase-like protein